MITHVYICGKCEGEVPDRIFEMQYEDLREAGEAGPPLCPRCGSKRVERYFGHRLFTSIPGRRPDPNPERYAPLETQPRRGILSIGIRATEEMRDEIEKQIESFVEKADVTLIQPDAESDPAEDILGLRKGSVERALFDLRQTKMIRELEEGETISGFFMPISGDCNN